MMDYAEGTEVLDGGRVGFLLIHGIGGSPAQLKFLADGLYRAGHTVVCPLMSGHASTPAEFELSRWTEWFVSADLALERMQRDCDVIIVGGVSTGAIVALRLAATRKELIKGCAVYAPMFWPNGWAIPRAFRLFKLVRQKWLANLFTFADKAPYGIKDERLRKIMLDRLTADGRSISDVVRRKGGTLLEFRWLASDVTARLGDITQPVLAIHTRDDDQSDMASTLLLQSRLGGRVETMVLDDSYHMVVLDRQRQLVMDRTVVFAEKLVAELEAADQRQRFRVGQGRAR